MSKLLDALRRKYATPEEAVAALGLDTALLQEGGMAMDEATRTRSNRGRMLKAIAGTKLAQDADPEELGELLEALLGKEDDDNGGHSDDPMCREVDDILRGARADDTLRGRVRDTMMRHRADDRHRASDRRREADDRARREADDARRRSARDVEYDPHVPAVTDPRDHVPLSEEEMARKRDEEMREAEDRRREADDARKRLGRDETEEEEDARERASDARRRMGRDESEEERKKREDEEARDRKMRAEDAKKRLGRDEEPDEMRERMTRERGEDRKRWADDARKRHAADRRREADDARIRQAVDEAVSASERRHRETLEAERFVRDRLGQVPGLAADSAETIYRGALDAMGVDVKNVHPTLYRSLLERLPRPGAPTVVNPRPRQGGGTEGFSKMFPDAGRIEVQ